MLTSLFSLLFSTQAMIWRVGRRGGKGRGRKGGRQGKGWKEEETKLSEGGRNNREKGWRMSGASKCKSSHSVVSQWWYSEIWNQKPGNQRPGIRNLESEIWTLKAGIWKLESGLWKLESGLWNLESETWNLDLKSEIKAIPVPCGQLGAPAVTVPQGLHRTREKKAVRTTTLPCLTETETQVNEIKLDSKTDELMKTFLNTGPKYCPNSFYRRPIDGRGQK